MEGEIFIMIKASLHSLFYKSFSPSFYKEISLKSKNIGRLNRFGEMFKLSLLGSVKLG